MAKKKTTKPEAVEEQENEEVVKTYDGDAVNEEENVVVADDSEVEVTPADEEDEKALPVVTGHTTVRLNIRENDSGDDNTNIVAIVNAGEELQVFVGEECSAIFFKVKTKAGVEGFAMRRYIILDAK